MVSKLLFALVFVLFGTVLSAQSFVDPETGAPSPLLSSVSGDYDLVFSDEFNDTSIDLTKWNITTSSKSRAARAKLSINDWWWKSDNVSETGGNAVLQVVKHDFNTMYCGSIDSNNKYEIKYGYFETRIEIAQADKGTHTAFWFQGDNMNNIDDSGNDGAEVDVFESAWLGDYTKAVVHIDGYGAQKQANTIKYDTPGLHTGFHTWGFHWEENFMRIYYDGNFAIQYTGDKWIPRVEEYMWLSDGASFGIEGDYFTSEPNGYLTEAKVDYVRVWQKPDGFAPSEPEKQLYWEDYGDNLNTSTSTSHLAYILPGSVADDASNTTDWIATVGNTSNQQLTAVAALDLTGYPKSGSGSSFRTWTQNASGVFTNQNIEYARRIGNIGDNETVYLTFLGSAFRLNKPGASTFPIGFMELISASTGAITKTWGPRLLIKNLETTNANQKGANYQLGIQNQNGDPNFPAASKLFKANGNGDGDAAVFIVMKLTMGGVGGDQLQLFASTAVPIDEPTTWDVSVSDGTDLDINAIFIREKMDQDIANGSYPDHFFNMSGIRVADSWDGLFATVYDEDGWSLGEPSADIASIVQDDLNLTGAIATKSLFIKSGNTVNVLSAATLDVKGDVENQGSLIVASGGSLLTYEGAGAAASVDIIRNSSFTDGDLQYSFIGSPVSNFDIGGLNSDFHFGYNTADDSYVPFSGSMVEGQGYTSAGKQELVFTGTPNTGDIIVSVDLSGNGFNLISNPYAVAINRTAFISANPVINGTIYLWDDGGSNNNQRTNSDFVTINNAGTVSAGTGESGATFNGYIGSAQGFIVQTDISGSVTFTEAMRVGGENSDDHFFREEQEDLTKIKLSLSSDNGSDQILLAFTERATDGLDRLWDGLKDPLSNSVELCTFLEDKKLAIQSFSELTDTKLDIPLGFKLTQSGSYRLGISENSLPPSYSVFLHDDQGTLHLLSSQDGININLPEGEVLGYSLVISRVKPVMGVSPAIKEVLIRPENGQIQIAFDQAPGAVHLEVVDISGKRLYKGNFNANQVSIPNSNALSKGIVIFRIETENHGLITRRMKFL